MAFWAAAAPILGQLGSSLLDNVLNHFSTQQANQMSYDQSVKLWNMNNEYNKPINQMNRLEEAGLNPFLVYGNGATGNTSAQPSSPSVQRTKFNVDLANALLLGKNLEKLQEEVDLTRKKNSLLRTQLGNLRYNSQLFKSVGLPTNASWWSPALFSLIRDPQKINWLKKLGFNISDFLWNNNPKFFKDNEYPVDNSGINKDWLNNGRVSETYYEFTE